MKTYLLSAGVGLLVGALYAIMHVRSPAPPMVALVGLCGIYPAVNRLRLVTN